MRDLFNVRQEKLDREMATPSGYCDKCGIEIYSDDELYNYGGLCVECWIDEVTPEAEDEWEEMEDGED